MFSSIADSTAAAFMPMTVFICFPLTAIAMSMRIVHRYRNIQSFTVIHTILIRRYTEFCIFRNAYRTGINFSTRTVLTRTGVIRRVIDSYTILSWNDKLLSAFYRNIVFLRRIFVKLCFSHLCHRTFRTDFLQGHTKSYRLFKACTHHPKRNFCISRQ